jgi:PAS domain S-box-containing protein
VTKKKADHFQAEELRRQAEARLKSEEPLAAEISPAEAKKLIHELRVHQIELEMQNDELRRAQEILEESRSRYTDLYDFAPIGYLTVDELGVIKEANLTAARHLQVERSRLLGRQVTHFMVTEDRAAFRRHLNLVLQGRERQSIELRLKRQDGQVFLILLESVFHQDTEGKRLCRAAFSDITGRRQAESDLQASEARYRSLFQNNHAVMLLINPATGDIVDANPAASAFYGYTHAELISRKITDINKLPTDHVFKEMQLAKSSQRRQFFFRHRLAGGEVRDVEVFSGPIRVKNQSLLYSIIHDITARKQAEEALRMKQEELQIILDSVPAPIFYKDKENRFIRTNQALAEVLGLPKRELDGKSLFDLFPDQAEDFWRDDQEVMRRGKPKRHIVEPLETPAGVRWFRTDKIPYHDDQGNIIGIIGFAVDITERKQAEEALRDSERRLSEIIDFLPDATFAIDLAGKVITWNRAIEEMTGVKAESMIGKGEYEYALPFYGLRRPKLIDLVLAPDAEIETQYALTRKAGDVLLAEAEVDLAGEVHLLWEKARPLFDSRGNVVGAIEAIRDITDRKRAEEERVRLVAQMQEGQRLESLGLLAGGIAHDFNNLLMAISGNADLALAVLPPGSPVRPSLQEIIWASVRAADLCRQMLAYAGKGRFVVGHYELSEIVREMWQILEVAVSKKGTLRYDFGADLPAEVDANQIRQVMVSLVTNASEALGEQGGIISVSTGVMDCDRAYLAGCHADDNLPEGRYVYLEVADTGSGIDEETQRRIFDPFFTTKFTGRGLGLAAVLGIVRGHRGAIKVHSEVGQGTTFKVLLPAKEWVPEDQWPSQAQSGQPIPSGRTILVIDDDPDVRRVGSRMLEPLGFKVLIAAAGQEGLDIFQASEGEIDCVILDLTMPGMGGEEVFRELRRLRPDVRVILSSGYNAQELTQRFGGQGLAGFIQKPYRMANLQEILNRVLS